MARAVCRANTQWEQQCKECKSRDRIAPPRTHDMRLTNKDALEHSERNSTPPTLLSYSLQQKWVIAGQCVRKSFDD